MRWDIWTRNETRTKNENENKKNGTYTSSHLARTITDQTITIALAVNLELVVWFTAESTAPMINFSTSTLGLVEMAYQHDWSQFLVAWLRRHACYSMGQPSLHLSWRCCCMETSLGASPTAGGLASGRICPVQQSCTDSSWCISQCSMLPISWELLQDTQAMLNSFLYRNHTSEADHGKRPVSAAIDL
jgi:hypothetical protein